MNRSVLEVRQLMEEAIQIVSDLDRDQSDATIDRAAEWTARSDEHQRCFDEAADALNALRVHAATQRDSALTAEVTPFRTARAVEANDPSLKLPSPLPLLAKAACVVLALGGASLWYLNKPLLYEAGSDPIEVQLGDGSRAVLLPQARMTRGRLWHSHELDVLKGGISFDLTPAPNDPYVISAGKARIAVLGTQVNVLLRADRTSVFLESGRVRVTTESGRAELAPLQSVEVRETAISAVRSWPADDAPAASDRYRAFNTTLAKICDEFNDVGNRVVFEVSDSVAQKPFNVTLNLDDPEEWLDFLEQDKTLRVERRPGWARISDARR